VPRTALADRFLAKPRCGNRSADWPELGPLKATKSHFTMRETNGEPRTTSSSISIPDHLLPIETQAYQSFKMPASISTVTTADIPKNEKTARLRSSPDAETAPPLEVKEHDFFWTYTEEPHRTRRMAIIKAHPEVHPLPSLCPSQTLSIDMLTNRGNR